MNAKEYILRGARDLVLLGMGIYSTIGLFSSYQPERSNVVRGKIVVEEKEAPDHDKKINMVLKGKRNYNGLIPKESGKGKLHFDKAVIKDPVFVQKDTQELDIDDDGRLETRVQVYENSNYQRIMVAEVNNKVLAYSFTLAPMFPEDGTYNFLIIDRDLNGKFEERRAMKDRIPKGYLDDILAKD